MAFCDPGGVSENGSQFVGRNPPYEVVIIPYQIWPTSDAADFMTTFWAFLAHFTSSFERDPL